MPRANNRRRDLDFRPLRVTTEITTQWWRARPFQVRRLTGASSASEYRCPGCEQVIAVGMPHVVAWPADGVGGLDLRRHWHSRCWERRDGIPS